MKTTPSVMFVMKDHKLRTILSTRFEREGWNVETAEDAPEGERKAVRFRPKIFAVEWTETHDPMKKLVKHFRSLPTLHTAKIVFLLKHPSRERVDEAGKSGADSVMLWGSLSPKDVIKSFAKLLAV
jgi:DNA-binding response OmpR family regulator